MSSTSRIILTKVADEVVIKVISAVIPTLQHVGIDYFVVGAFARDIAMLAKGHNYPPERKTKDLDLAVLVGSNAAYEKLKDAVRALPDFKEHETEPYRFIFQNAYDVDLLPFGDIVDAKGQIELVAQKTITLDMPGFDLVFPFIETVETEDGLKINISSLPGVVLLKLLAWQDRPNREKDIRDISYILKHFMGLYFEDIGAGGIFDLYEDEDKLFNYLVAGRYTGRQMGMMLQEHSALRERVQQLLTKESKKSGMARLMPLEYIEDNQRIIEALLAGVNDWEV